MVVIPLNCIHWRVLVVAHILLLSNLGPLQASPSARLVSKQLQRGACCAPRVGEDPPSLECGYQGIICKESFQDSGIPFNYIYVMLMLLLLLDLDQIKKNKALNMLPISCGS